MTVWRLALRLFAIVLRGRGRDEVVAYFTDGEVEYEVFEVHPSFLRQDRFVIVRLRLGDPDCE